MLKNVKTHRKYSQNQLHSTNLIVLQVLAELNWIVFSRDEQTQFFGKASAENYLFMVILVCLECF